MKKTIVMMLILGMMASFSPDPGSVKRLTGYKLRTESVVLNDFNLWVVTQELAFDKLFIAESASVTRPGFEQEIVLAGKVETKTNAYAIQFKKYEVENAELNVYFGVQKIGPVEKASAPVSMITFPRNASVRKVNFYHDNILVKTIPIVAVF